MLHLPCMPSCFLSYIISLQAHSVNLFPQYSLNGVPRFISKIRSTCLFTIMDIFLAFMTNLTRDPLTYIQFITQPHSSFNLMFA